MSNFEMTIIVPSLNEEEVIIECLEWLKDHLDKFLLPAKVLVVDDQSDDMTHQMCLDWIKLNNRKDFEIISRTLDRRGYGAVVRRGVAAANTKYCVFVSADMVDPIHLIPEMYKKIKNGADLVQCSRYLNEGDSKTIPFSYKFYQFFYRIFVQICIGKYIADSTYAFKMFDREKVLELGMTQNRFSISPEIFLKTFLAELKIDYVIGGQGIRKKGISKFKFRLEGFGFLYCLLRAFLHKNKIIYWF